MTPPNSPGSTARDRSYRGCVTGRARSLRVVGCGAARPAPRPDNPLTRDQTVTYSRGVDAIFRALADPTRRSLLDELFREDGQTLSALEERFAMTRFGVMKHLKQLEDAGLVVTKKQGREKLHFLNPVPIRAVHDRWVSKFAAPWAAGLNDLKRDLEKTMEKVFEIYIRTPPERLWAAIPAPQPRAKYNFGGGVFGDWSVGADQEMRAGDFLLGQSQVLKVDPP